ncbi:MAG: DNA-protecting protein DprA [Holosporales bacterium]|jgi:DNA processing protein|nr:DNA-protecting protein DprA [Holosporales bacterium]
MFDDVVLDWFCLISSNGIGPKTFWALMRNYKTAKESLKHISTPFPRSEAQKILKSMNCDIILANEKAFPQSLRRSCFCPPMLFCRGNKSILSKRRIAIIGARNASISGRSIARTMASKLSNEFAVISGLAKGIDTATHLGSLECLENRSAIAILPFGFDSIYPKENTALFEKLATKAVVLTEVPNGRHNDQGMFHARNRIIALMAEAIIVIEAAAKSGTLSTAKLALDFGCEVLVIPGSPADPRNFGSNMLIKNGATLVQNHADVVEAIGNCSVQATCKEQTTIQVDMQEQFSRDHSQCRDGPDKILSMLSDIPISLDEIALHTDVCMRDLLCIVSELEISGKIVKYPTNEIALVRT